MKTTPFLLSLSLFVAPALLVGCGKDGKSPKIESFTASSTSLPEGGAPVTFTWDVRREKTVELLPFPGVVTGSSATVNVTEPTTFTLLAKNSDGSARKKVTIATGEAMTVTGQVVDYKGQPVPSAYVFVDDVFVVADEDGVFVVSGVVAPYDLGYVATESGLASFGGPVPGSVYAALYRGVTRPDPKLLHGPGTVAPYSADIAGTVTGGEGFPYPTPTPNPSYQTNVVFSSPAFSEQTVVDGATGAFVEGMSWSGNPTQPYVANVLQYRHTPSVSFLAHGRQTGTVTDGESLDLDIAMSPIGTGHITGTATAPFAATYVEVSGSAELGAPDMAPPGAVLGGLPLPYGERISLPGAVTTNGTFSFAHPELQGATFSLFAFVQADDGYSYLVEPGHVAGETAVELEVPPIAIPLTPVDGASIDESTVFSMSPVDEAVYAYTFYSAGNSGFPAFGGAPQPSLYIEVFSSSNATSFPEQDLLVGASLDGRYFEWNGRAMAGYATVDGLVENGMVPPSGGYAVSGSFDSRYFFYGAPSGPF